jgi:hypothetical protein
VILKKSQPAFLVFGYKVNDDLDWGGNFLAKRKKTLNDISPRIIASPCLCVGNFCCRFFNAEVNSENTKAQNKFPTLLWIQHKIFIQLFSFTRENYFFPARAIRAIIIATTTTTTKIPTPIPALNIPPIAAHELNMIHASTHTNATSRFEFFINVLFSK